jgi:hypothetical protein
MTDANVLDAWSAALARSAISEVDRRAVVASENARSLALERLHPKSETDHDALHAWASLARVLADASASPSLVAGVVDALVPLVRDTRGVTWAELARATLVEAFVAAIRESCDQRVADAWRFPRCVVRLDATSAAVAAHFPDDDSDAVARWADEVAAGLAKMGVRRVHAEGTARARAALKDALAIAGIDLVARPL